VKTRNRWKAELPNEVVETLQQLKSTDNNAKLHSYIVALRNKGWSLSAIAKPLDLSRERVRQLSITHPFDIAQSEMECISNGYNLPSVPAKPVKPKRVVPDPDPAVVSRLLELQPMAQQVRGVSQKFREQGEEYTQLIASEVSRGVPAYRVAKSLGVTNSAVMFRLVRYGYAESKSTAKVFRPIEHTNR
jgi:hypothetical protein